MPAAPARPATIDDLLAELQKLNKTAAAILQAALAAPGAAPAVSQAQKIMAVEPQPPAELVPQHSVPGPCDHNWVETLRPNSAVYARFCTKCRTWTPL